MNLELVRYLTDRVITDRANQDSEIDHSIQEALKDRLNEYVKLVQEYDVNKPYADMLRTAVFLNVVMIKSKKSGE